MTTSLNEKFSRTIDAWKCGMFALSFLVNIVGFGVVALTVVLLIDLHLKIAALTAMYLILLTGAPFFFKRFSQEKYIFPYNVGLVCGVFVDIWLLSTNSFT